MILLQVPSASIEDTLDTLLYQLAQDSTYMINLAQAIGGLGAVIYFFSRIWPPIIRNEEIDIYPLFRPFALAFCLVLYTNITSIVINLNAALSQGTEAFYVSKQATVDQLNTQKDQLLQQRFDKNHTGNPDVDQDGEVSFMETLQSWIPLVSAASYVADGMKLAVQSVLDEVLTYIGEKLYETASLLIKLLQTYFLLVLLIMGPITLGLACFEWFYGGLAAWVTRIIHLLLWLPLVNILGGLLESVHIQMLYTDIAQIKADTGDFTQTDFTQIIFYLLGTVAYLLVPTAASWIVESTGVGNAVSTARSGVRSTGGLLGGLAGAGAAGGSIVGKTVGRLWSKI